MQAGKLLSGLRSYSYNFFTTLFLPNSFRNLTSVNTGIICGAKLKLGLSSNDKWKGHTCSGTECPSHPAVTSSSTTVVLYPLLLVVELLICIHIRNLCASEGLPRIMNIITHIHIYKR